MEEVGRGLRLADVRRIVLVHGTFVGPDAWGLLTQLSRFSPEAAQAIARLDKAIVDRIVGQAGNYTQEYAEQFAAAINQPGRPPIAVERFQWSSENNHIGRSHAAIKLLKRIATTDEANRGRVLLWGHSHAGNVFALLTNLLGADQQNRDRFFRAARCYFQTPFLRRVDLPVWNHVRELLDTPSSPLQTRPLDIATFGTPIRYGWDTAGYARLLHFVHHIPRDNDLAHWAEFPPRIVDVLAAAGGDYVQQTGIAGTNIAPSLLTPRSLVADWRLNRILQHRIRARDLLGRLAVGRRVAEEGRSLLIDYGPQGSIAEHVAGHAVYTKMEWLLFHAEQVVQHFYARRNETDPRDHDD